VKRWDGSVLVFDMCIGDGIVPNYPFAGRWFEVQCSFDLGGHLRIEAGPVDWALYHFRPPAPSYPVMHVIERIVGPLGLRVDHASPWVDARLPDGSRVQTYDFQASLPT
jgi:hypothetical protein